MKNKNIITRIWALALCILGTMSLAGCLEDSDETVTLEGGFAKDLLMGTWKVDKSQLYDINTDLYHSDMPDDIHYIYTFEEGGVGEIYIKEANAMSWYINETGKTIDIDGDIIGNKTYTIASLGEKVLVLESVRNVNGETYKHRYILKKTKGGNSIGNNGDDDDDDNNGDNNGDDDDDNNGGIEDGDDDETQVVSSNEGKSFRRFGYTITVPRGAVPTNSKGEAGSVAFSVQLVGTDELPKAISYGTPMEQGCLKIEPMNFTFNSPIIIKVPLQGNNHSKVGVFWYDESVGEWTLIPFSKINSDGTASIAVMELGYFVVVYNFHPDFGGVHISNKYLENGYFYYLTLTPQGAYRWLTHSRVIGFTSDGEDLYMHGMDYGTYSATLTREKRTSISSGATSIETMNLGEITVSTMPRPKDNNWENWPNFDEMIEWTEISLDGKSWSNGRPSSWGDATVTYGTGKFQATLTWVNSAASVTDYDLHLTTPQGKEVYFGNKQAGAFELDRDWIRELGNAIENIYSVRDNFDRGTYKVRVHHFWGATGTRYNCRIIVNGTVVKSVTNSIRTSGAYDDIYTFTIE